MADSHEKRAHSTNDSIAEISAETLLNERFDFSHLLELSNSAESTEINLPPSVDIFSAHRFKPQSDSEDCSPQVQSRSPKIKKALTTFSELVPIRVKPATHSDTSRDGMKETLASDHAVSSPETPHEVNTCPRCSTKKDGDQPQVGSKRKNKQRQTKARCDVGIKSVLRAIKTFLR